MLCVAQQFTRLRHIILGSALTQARYALRSLMNVNGNLYSVVQFEAPVPGVRLFRSCGACCNAGFAS